jgi:predicted RNase H-like nuclease (RuvC/YqgF family)
MVYMIALAILGSIVAGFMFGYVAAGALMTSAGLAEQQESDKLRNTVDSLHSTLASTRRELESKSKELELTTQAATRLQAESELMQTLIDKYRAKLAEFHEIESGDLKTWQAVA